MVRTSLGLHSAGVATKASSGSQMRQARRLSALAPFALRILAKANDRGAADIFGEAFRLLLYAVPAFPAAPDPRIILAREPDRTYTTAASIADFVDVASVAIEQRVALPGCELHRKPPMGC
jgi:hypothetical protein